MGDLLEGIEVEPKGIPPGGSEFSVTYEPWLPDTPEDQLLVSYWENVGGAIIAEVPTASEGSSNWPDSAKSRRIDGIRFKCKGRDEIYPPSAYTTEQIKKIVKGRHVEVIEAKQSLNRNVIGYAVAGRDLFLRDYNPASVEPVAVCGSDDPALSWVCRRNGIRVEIFEGVES